jgi:hypothetical protein
VISAFFIERYCRLEPAAWQRWLRETIRQSFSHGTFNVQRSTFNVWRLAGAFDVCLSAQDIGNSFRGHPRNIVTFYF